MNFFIINREGSLRIKKYNFFNRPNNLLFFFSEFFDDSEFFEIDLDYHGNESNEKEGDEKENHTVVDAKEEVKTEVEAGSIIFNNEVDSEKQSSNNKCIDSSELEDIKIQFDFILHNETIENHYILFFYLAIVIKKGLIISNLFIKKKYDIFDTSCTNNIIPT